MEIKGELKRLVALKLGKMPDEDITSVDLDRIDEFTFNAYLMNGQKSGITLDDIKLFKNIKRLKLSNYKINQEAIQTIASLEYLEQLEIFGAEFEEDISFDDLGKNVKKLKFNNCLEIKFPYPKLEEVWINRTDIDFKKIDLNSAKRIIIKNSHIKNICDLTDFPQLENVDFDGTELTNENGEKVQNIKVGVKTKYTHQDTEELFNEASLY